jgi:pSer/pThr/pTyr-binding forkhead associated (FHA) protein
MKAQLIPIEGGTTPIEITRDLTLVGRKEDCDLRLEHKSVSKMHCVIAKTDGLLFVRDLGSTNGTRVNGQRVRRAALPPNDQLTIANYKFRVTIGPDDPGAPAAAAPAPYEHTQQMDPKDVAHLLRKKGTEPPEADESSAELPSLPAQHNPLPDVYPEDEHKHN